MIAVPQKKARREVQIETAMRVTGEESPPETPPMTGGEDMESETAETIETEVKGFLCQSLQEFQL